MHEQAAVSGRAGIIDPYEAQLVERLKERVPEAWDEAYARHHTQVYRYIHARVFEPATAEDLTSTVFLGAVKNIGSYRYQGQPLLAWLYRIARNVVSSHRRDMFRQRTVRLDTITELPGRMLGRRPREPRTSASDDPGTEVERMDLREAISKLPQSQREVLVLKFFVGLDAREVASIVGKDVAAVYSLHARALDGLRRRLVQAS
jgi:RNA polymerase sigma-70 factor, ECF subfamily